MPGGPRIADRYVVLRAQGGDIYLARDLEVERDVAVELFRDLATFRRCTARRSRCRVSRTRTSSRCSRSASTATVRSSRRELVEGTSLRSWLAEKHRSRREILAVLLAAGEGLAAAHAAGVFHRDVSRRASSSAPTTTRG